MNIKQTEKALSNNHWKVQKSHLTKRDLYFGFLLVSVYSYSPNQLLKSFCTNQLAQINDFIHFLL